MEVIEVLHTAVKVRLYPTPEQEVLLAQHFGCARWWWNFALNKSIETYKETGQGLGRSALNALLPQLKKLQKPSGCLNVTAKFYKLLLSI